MYWNYRILRVDFDKSSFKDNKELLELSPDYNYKIVEVYYNDDGGIEGWADSTYDTLLADNVEDLKGTVALLPDAFNEPVLKIVDDDKLEEVED